MGQTPQRFASLAGGGADNACEQEKLEARKMLAVGAARREAAVPSVQCIIPAHPAPVARCRGPGRFVRRQSMGYGGP